MAQDNANNGSQHTKFGQYLVPSTKWTLKWVHPNALEGLVTEYL